MNEIPSYFVIVCPVKYELCARILHECLYSNISEKEFLQSKIHLELDHIVFAYVKKK